MIPKTIHQAWIPPRDWPEMPPETRTHAARWTETHPDFNVTRWSIADVLAALHPCDRLRDAVAVVRFETMQADLIRYALLHRFGGFWADLKVAPRIRWLDRHLATPLLLVEHFQSPIIADPHRDGVLASSLLGCEPGSAFFAACLEGALRNVERRLSTTLWEISGPRLVMDVYHAWPPPLDHTLIPHDDAWNRLLVPGGGQFSEGETHWSEREQRESMYLDGTSRADPSPDWRTRYARPAANPLV